MSNLSTPLQIASGTVTASGGVDPFPVGTLTSLAIDINVTAITGTVQFTYSRVDSFGNLYPIWSGGLGGVGTISDDIGAGMNVAHSPGSEGVLSWILSPGSPSCTFSALVQGK